VGTSTGRAENWLSLSGVPDKMALRSSRCWIIEKKTYRVAADRMFSGPHCSITLLADELDAVESDPFLLVCRVVCKDEHSRCQEADFERRMKEMPEFGIRVAFLMGAD